MSSSISYLNGGDMWWHADPRDACLGLNLIISHLNGILVDDGNPQYVRTQHMGIYGRDHSTDELMAYEGSVPIARVSVGVSVQKVQLALDYLLSEMDGAASTYRRG